MKSRFFVIAIVLVLFVILLSGCTKKGSLQDVLGNKGNSGSGGTGGSSDGSSGSTGGTGGTGTQTNPTFETKLRDCVALDTAGKIDECLLDLGKREKNDVVCNRVVLISQDRCFYQIGTDVKDDFICGKIVNGDTKNDCLKSVGLATGKEETCDKISNKGYRDECMLNSAIKNAEGDTCGKIFAPDSRDSCYRQVAVKARDAFLCDNVKQGDKDSCYLSVPGKLPGEICAKLNDVVKRVDCFVKADNIPIEEVNCTDFTDTNSTVNCSLWYSKKTGDADYCYNIKDARKTHCLEVVVDIYPDSETCGKIQSTDTTVKNLCVIKAAVIEKEIGACENIKGNSSLKRKCKIDVAVELGDTELCYSSPGDIGGSDDCLSRIALAQRDLSLCEDIRTDRAYFWCYADIALNFSAPDVCEKAPRDNLKLFPYPAKEYCYNEYAVATEDTTICNNITFSAYKAECKQKIGNLLKCVDNDGVCEEDICSVLNDNDCKSPTYCEADSECNDNKSSTKDTCSIAEKKCKFETINECANGDHYCPAFCTYEGSPGATIIDEETEKTNEDADCIPTCEQKGGIVCAEEKTCLDPIRGTTTEFTKDSCCQPDTTDPETSEIIEYCVTTE